MNPTDFTISQEIIDSILEDVGLESLSQGRVKPLDDFVSER